MPVLRLWLLKTALQIAQYEDTDRISLSGDSVFFASLKHLSPLLDGFQGSEHEIVIISFMRSNAQAAGGFNEVFSTS